MSAVLDRLLPRDHRAILVAYLVVALLSVLGNSVAPPVLGTIGTPLFVPLLALWVLLARGARSPRLLLAGLALAWLGDIALVGPGDTRFLLGLGCFLGMQVCYSLGFIGLGALSGLRARPWLPAGAVVLWVALNLVVGPSTGDMRLPMAVYSAFLVAMATLSLGVTTRVGWGGSLFLVSDLLIGVHSAGVEFPGRGLLVTGTYALAQLFIVTGWVEVLDQWDGDDAQLSAARAA